jgi:hypothetical protein
MFKKKGSYWTIDNNYQEVALNNPIKIKQKVIYIEKKIRNKCMFITFKFYIKD